MYRVRTIHCVRTICGKYGICASPSAIACTRRQKGKTRQNNGEARPVYRGTRAPLETGRGRSGVLLPLHIRKQCDEAQKRTAVTKLDAATGHGTTNWHCDTLLKPLPSLRISRRAIRCDVASPHNAFNSAYCSRVRGRLLRASSCG